jgi:hypothetical protein
VPARGFEAMVGLLADRELRKLSTRTLYIRAWGRLLGVGTSPSRGSPGGLTIAIGWSDLDCKVCQSRLNRSHTAVVLGKYEAAYHYCDSCGFLCVHDPHWLDEAYSNAIAALDTGVVARNLAVAAQLVVVLERLAPAGPYLDVGGGHGLLVRRMRDLGFPFRWSDAYASNHYARGFEDDGRTYEAVTAIEVLEHLEDPLKSLRMWIETTSADTFIFTQETFDGSPPPKDWWYYARVEGQHISFFQPRTLEYIAGQLDMYYTPIGKLKLHAFTRHPVTPGALDKLFFARPRAMPLYAAWLGRKRETLRHLDFRALADTPRLGNVR